MNEMTQVLGIVAMEPKGEYNPTTYYEKLNVVTCGDFTYMATEGVVGEHPSSSNKWQCIGGIVDDAVSVVNDIATMKTSAGLIAGTVVETKGYYASGDGGGAKYEIVDDDTLVEDGGYIHELSNGLFAVLVIDKNVVDIRQLGGKKLLRTDTTKFDNKICMTRYLSLLDACGEKIELYIPVGVWCFSETLISRWNGVIIRGEKIFPRDEANCTCIVPISDEQRFIWKVGGIADVDDVSQITIGDMTTCCHFEGLCFKTRYYSTNYKVTKACFYIDCTMYMTFEDIYIFNFEGNGLAMRTSWELNFKTLMFRGQIGFDYSCLLFANTKDVDGVSPNISALDIQSMLFEGIDGKYIYSEPGSGFSHNHIGHINIETAWGGAADSYETQEFSTDVSDCIPIDMISGFYRFCVIDSINIVYNNPTVAIKGNNKYYLRALIRDKSADVLYDYGKRCFISVSNIIYRTVGNSSKLSVFSARKSYEYNGFSLGTLSFQDNVPERIFDCDYSTIPVVGEVLRVNRPLTATDIKNDAYLYACRRNVCYDSTSPTRYKLVARRRPASDTDVHAIVEWNCEKINDSVNPLTIRFLVKNNTDSDVNARLYFYINGNNTFSSYTIPVSNNEWQEISFTEQVDLGSQISFRSESSTGDISVAKVYY